MKPTEPAAMLSAGLIAEVKALRRDATSTANLLCECREQAIEQGDEESAVRFTKRLDALAASIDGLLAAVRDAGERYQR